MADDDILRVRCPECGKKYKIEPPKKFRCKECETVIRVDENGEVALPSSKKPEKKASQRTAREESSRAEKKDAPAGRESTSRRGRKSTGASRRQSTRRRKAAEPAEERSTSRRGRSGGAGGGRAPRSSGSPMGLYIGLGGGAVVLVVIGLVFALGGSGGGEEAAGPGGAGAGPARTGLFAELQLAMDTYDFTQEKDADWTITNRTGKRIDLTYTPHLRCEVLKGNPKRDQGLGVLPSPHPEPATKTQELEIGASHSGDEPLSIEALGIDDSLYTRVQLAIWVEFDRPGGSFSTDRVEVEFHAPDRTELEEYVGTFATAPHRRTKRRMLAMVARHSTTGFEEFFATALADESPEVRLTAAGFAVDRNLPGIADKLAEWKSMKMPDDQKQEVEALIARLGQ